MRLIGGWERGCRLGALTNVTLYLLCYGHYFWIVKFFSLCASGRGGGAQKKPQDLKEEIR